MNIIQGIKQILKNLEEDHISESAAQCAYYIILSFVPFTILVLTLLQYTNIEAEQLFNIISKMIPESLNETILSVIKEIYSKSIGTISVSLIITLYAAGRGLFGLMKGLHKVYNYSDNRRQSVIYLRFMSIVETLIFIVIIVVGLVILLFGQNIINTLQERLNMFPNFNWIYRILTHIVIIFLTFLTFLCVYKFVPGHKIKFKSQVVGAAFAAVALNVVSFIFGNYVDLFGTRYSSTYGGLTTLMSILVWVYVCFYVIFLGAEINKFIFKWGRFSNEKRGVVFMKKTKEIINEAKKYFMYFMFYAIIGWIYEVFLEVVVYKWGFSNRGVLFGPYCPVYGFGAIAFIFTVYKLIKGKDLKTKIIRTPLVFLGCMAIATLLELATSYICEAIMGYWPWQTYSDYAINFQARIALSPSLRFGLGGVVFLYVLQPIFEKICEKMNNKVFNFIFYFLLIVIICDLIATVIL